MEERKQKISNKRIRRKRCFKKKTVCKIDWEDFADLEGIVDIDELLEGTSISEDDIMAVAETFTECGHGHDINNLIEYMFEHCEPPYKYLIQDYESRHIIELCMEYVTKNYGGVIR